MRDTDAGKLSKKQINLFFQLLLKNPWLNTDARIDALRDLLDLCADIYEQTLVTELINRFNYISSSMLANCYNRIVNKIIDDWKYLDHETQIVASSNTPEADSSQVMVQDLKICFARRGWQHYRPVNHLSKASKHIGTHPKIILVDEFSGTGKTFVSRVRTLRQQLGNNSPATLKICLLACMKDAKQHIEDSTGLEVHAEIVMQKGISAHYSGAELATAVDQMKRLESMLAPKLNDLNLPSFGYGEAEALYSRDQGNTPNNVFPVFWWSHLANQQRRNTLLHRWESPDAKY